MYGTIARVRVKPGMEDKFMEMFHHFEELDVPGYLGTYCYRMDVDSHEFYMAVAFKDKETYVKNADSQEQDARYKEMAELFEGEPEWHDGEIVYASAPVTV
jgi:antibiotic biosynthesis monooxygenase (ABM) superfamily enzyme